jgi:uncharacterized protein (TIGR02246 family)
LTAGDVNSGVPEDPPTVVVERLAIADLVHGYAQRLDRRDPEGVAELFTQDAMFVAYTTPGAEEPTTRCRGRADIAEAMRTVRHYRATAHTIGNHVASVDRDRATGETRCVAYHLLGDDEAETLLVWYLRYLDRYVRARVGWRIEERELRVDIVTSQPLQAG